MIDFTLVDVPAVYPSSCVFCQNHHGPLVDTHIDRWGENLYICSGCAQRIARTLGIAKGERMSDLMNADKLIGEKDKEIERLIQQQSELRQVNASLRNDLATHKSQLQAINARLDQTRHLAAAVERSSEELLQVVVSPVEETADV